MNFKQYAKILMDRNPQISRHHGTPKTRRELLSQGFISGSAMALMPSLASLVSQKAMGACASESATFVQQTPVLIIDGAGGWNIPGRNIIVGGAGGQEDYLGAGEYASIGLLPESEPTKIAPHTDFGLQMASVSGFHRGLTAGTTEATRASVDGMMFAIRSQNDTGNNPSNPSKWLVKAGAQGEVVNLIGTEDSDFGGNSLGPAESMYVADRPVRVTNPNSAIGLVLPGVLASLSAEPNNAFIQKVFKVVGDMSKRQLARFNQLAAKEQAQILCAYSDAEFQASSFDATTLDPTLDPDINLALGGVFDLTNGTETRTASLAKLALDGFVGVAVQRIGGCDYHNNSFASVNGKDEEIGKAAGQFIEAAARKGKNAHVIVYTDGGTGASGNNADPDYAAAGMFGPTSDSGTRSGMFTLTYQASGGRVELVGGRQIGHYTSAGEAENANAVSDSVASTAEAIVANYIALHTPEGVDPAKHIEDELNRVVGRNSFGPDLAQYVSYGRLK